MPSLALQASLNDVARREAAGDLAGAIAACTDCIAADPGRPAPWSRLGMLFIRLMKWQQAIENFELALQLEPGHADALHGLAVARFHLGQPQAARDLADAAASAAPDDWRVHASRAYIHATTLADPAHTLAVYRAWGARFADPLTERASPVPALDAAGRNPRRRLRVGYVSGDLREHSIAFFMAPVFRHHDPEQVDVFVYATGRADDTTAALRATVPHWREVGDLSDTQLLDRIRRDRIDVLVDLSGHTEGQRLFVFARRAAPVQVTWLGFMHPLGMQAMDYRLTDAGIDPPGAEVRHSETLFRLSCMASYAPPPTPLQAEPPMTSYGRPTFISLNNSKKVTDAMLATWGRILAARPDADLVLMVQERTPEDAQAQMAPRLAALGLPLERIHISPQLPLADFMALGAIADVALDTSPVSGGTTTLHALWMGLPVVTLEAEEAAQASTARTLQGLGLHDWVASDADAYVARALDLVADVDALRAHRNGLRGRLEASALMDYRARTAELERAYRLMWLNHLIGERRYLHGTDDLEAAIRDAGSATTAGAGGDGSSDTPRTGQAPQGCTVVTA